jgi:hypothetical protein
MVEQEFELDFRAAHKGLKEHLSTIMIDRVVVRIDPCLRLPFAV